MPTTLHPTIILVDDEPAVLAILHRIMHDLANDYDLIPVQDGATALVQIAQRSVALVITDYQMPDMDGVELTTAIKARAPDCPIVLITAHPSPNIWQRAHEAGADFYLPKPFSFDRLEAVVQAALTH
jgi:two-component system, response regulator, stage 0 sporulation protein F